MVVGIVVLIASLFITSQVRAATDDLPIDANLAIFATDFIMYEKNCGAKAPDYVWIFLDHATQKYGVNKEAGRQEALKNRDDWNKYGETKWCSAMKAKTEMFQMLFPTMMEKM